MPEEIDFENELTELLAQSGEDTSAPTHITTQLPVLSPVQLDHSKDKILSQAQIDAILASMNLG
jgi:hypothetical protein